MRQEFPHIRPFEEENDIYWWNTGWDALKVNQLAQAERIFKKLTLAQPEHFDGYYGLALVYQRRHRLADAILFADEAIRIYSAGRLIPQLWMKHAVGSEISIKPMLEAADKALKIIK